MINFNKIFSKSGLRNERRTDQSIFKGNYQLIRESDGFSAKCVLVNDRDEILLTSFSPKKPYINMISFSRLNFVFFFFPIAFLISTYVILSTVDVYEETTFIWFEWYFLVGGPISMFLIFIGSGIKIVRSSKYRKISEINDPSTLEGYFDIINTIRYDRLNGKNIFVFTLEPYSSTKNSSGMSSIGSESKFVVECDYGLTNQYEEQRSPTFKFLNQKNLFSVEYKESDENGIYNQRKLSVYRESSEWFHLSHRHAGKQDKGFKKYSQTLSIEVLQSSYDIGLLFGIVLILTNAIWSRFPVPSSSTQSVFHHVP